MKTVYRWLFTLLIFPFSCLALELAPLEGAPYDGDFDVQEKKGAIRVLVSADLGLYYVEKGKPKGMVSNLLYHFETQIKKKHPYVNIQIIPLERDDLIPSLLSGYGDLIVSNLTITDRRKKQIDFSQPMLTEIKEFILTARERADFVEIDKLSGEEIWVRASSSYFQSLLNINEYLDRSGLAPINVHFFEESIEDYEIVEMVNQGHINATILDSHKAELWLGVMDNIKIHDKLPVREGGEIAWAFRKNSPKLEKLVNQFIRTSRSGTLLGNVLYEKYIEDPKWLSRALNPAKIKYTQSLIAVFEKYGNQYGFDWMMVAAQAFQESGLDNRKVSHKGAVGIMQVLPSTARDPKVNIKDIKKLENNVHAGVKYLRFIKDRYFSDEEISPDNQIYFSLAAYNAGPANIRRMRRLAQKHGYDHNVWFKNVEVIARRNIGREPVKYVANINRYYVIYKQLNQLNKLKVEQTAALEQLVTPGQ